MAAIASPNPMAAALLASVAPDYQTQQLQAERRLAMAQQLQQMAMSDTPGNGGAVSWTQGLARVLDGLASRSLARRGYADMTAANVGLGRAYGKGAGQYVPDAPQMAQGAPTAASGGPTPPPPQNAPSAAPFVPGAPAAAGQADPLAPLTVAPPQAASTPPPAPSPAPTGGATNGMHWQPGPFALTGTPEDQSLMLAPGYMDAVVANKAKGAAPTDLEVTLAHARQALQNGDVATASALLGNVNKQNYIAPISGRPGGWTIFADGHREYNPQSPAPGAMPVMGPDGKPTGAWTEDPSASAIQAHQAGAVKGAQAAADAPYEFNQVFNQQTGQMEYVPVSAMAGGGGTGGQGGAHSLNNFYGRNSGQPSGFAAGPPMGAAEAASVYGKGQAQGALDIQAAAATAPQVIQSYREMQHLLDGGLKTGPARALMQQTAEEFGLTFLAQDNAFIFNKDAARAVAQDAQAVGLNGSDARLGMLATANPSMKMPQQALQHVLPVMIGLKMAVIAKSVANANWIAQHGPQSNAQFNNWWLQHYDPRMFTAIAMGPGFVARRMKDPAWAKSYTQKYDEMKGLGVNFGQFAQ